MPSAAILVGGRARRFGGRRKSSLIVDGRSILERQVAELQQVVDDIMLVGLDAGESEERCPVDVAAIRAVPDRVPGSGPLGGLDAALEATRHNEVVLLACDMPFVTAPFLAWLVVLASTADAVVPKTKRGYHPLCAVYTRACHAAVKGRLSERRLRMLDSLDAVRVRTVEGDEIDRYGGERLLANVNTPAEFSELETLLGHKP